MCVYVFLPNHAPPNSLIGNILNKYHEAAWYKSKNRKKMKQLIEKSQTNHSPGFIKLPRKFIPLLLSQDEELASMGKLFLLLLGRASYKNRTVIYMGQRYVCKRGNVIDSKVIIAKTLHIGRKRLDRLLNGLQQLKWIEVKTYNRVTIFTILDFDFFSGSTEEEKQNDAQGSFFEAERSLGGRCLYVNDQSVDN